MDDLCGDAELLLMRDQAVAGDWAALREGLAAITDQTELTWVLIALAEVAGVEEWTSRAVAEEPDSALPLLLSGARQVAWAWEARTRQSAKHVSQDQWKAFRSRLATAEEQLFEVAEREPEWLAPWYFLQHSGRGASLDQEVCRYRFEAALRRRPGHLASHQARLQQLCAKWGGSHEAMHAFAQASMRAQPEGSPFGELVALAHLERWVDLDGGDAGRAYLTRPEVLAELREAAERSVLHPDFQRRRGWQATYNSFAMALSLAGERATAHRLFQALDGTATTFPWRYLSGTPVDQFGKHRDLCAQ
ncbi:hypothetical protein GXP74_25670 [Streptacidiphilus sp. P02-A3a]|nr:hypothetical protein GXP74_25670 [Streptacidiphilus sp. P02-A3a]